MATYLGAVVGAAAGNAAHDVGHVFVDGADAAQEVGIEGSAAKAPILSVLMMRLLLSNGGHTVIQKLSTNSDSGIDGQTDKARGRQIKLEHELKWAAWQHGQRHQRLVGKVKAVTAHVLASGAARRFRPQHLGALHFSP